MDSNSILTICVNYQSDQETEEFLNSLLGLNGYDEQLALVVNNGQTRHEDDNMLFKIARDDRVILKYSKKNLGYFGGANWGLQEYLKDNTLPDWVIVSNTDIEFHDPNFFIKLKNYHKINSPAVVAPDIQLQTDNLKPSSLIHQNPHLIKRPSRVHINVMKWISTVYPIYICWEIISGVRYFLINRFFRSKDKDAQSLSEIPREIYSPFGAFIIFHRSYFERGGDLQYGGFLFGEEIFVAEQLRKLRLKAVFDNRLKVIHREHASLISVSSRQQTSYVKESAKYLIDTFF